jgi:hypothetical protein
MVERDGAQFVRYGATLRPGDETDVVRLYRQGYAYARVRQMLGLKVSIQRMIGIVERAKGKVVD